MFDAISCGSDIGDYVDGECGVAIKVVVVRFS